MKNWFSTQIASIFQAAEAIQFGVYNMQVLPVPFDFETRQLLYHVIAENVELRFFGSALWFIKNGLTHESNWIICWAKFGSNIVHESLKTHEV